MPLNENDTEYAELRRQLQEILAQRNDLKIRLKTVEDEVKELKKTTSNHETSIKKQQQKILMLENDRRTLKVRLATVEAQKIRQENEMKDLAKQNEDRKEENRKLNEKLQLVENKNEELQGEVKGLKEAIAPNYSEQTVAFVHIGELCCQIQNFMYKKILPDHYNSEENYKVKTIEKDINLVLKYESQRNEAEKHLQELKTSLNWNKGLEDAVKSLQNSRNFRVHPRDRIDEASLRKYAKALHDQGQLKGRRSLEQVNELINIWLNLQKEQS